MSETVLVPPQSSNGCKTPVSLFLRIIVQFMVSFGIYLAAIFVLGLANISTRGNVFWHVVCIAPSMLFARGIHAHIYENLRECFAHDTYIRLWNRYDNIDEEKRKRVVTDMTVDALARRKLQRSHDALARRKRQRSHLDVGTSIF